MSARRFRKPIAVACFAFSSSVSSTIFSASWSPHSVTHSPHPLQRSETKIEKMPPAPGVFFSRFAKMALTLL